MPSSACKKKKQNKKTILQGELYVNYQNCWAYEYRVSRVAVNYRNLLLVSFFFFNDTATTEIYTLSLHDALPISRPVSPTRGGWPSWEQARTCARGWRRS